MRLPRGLARRAQRALRRERPIVLMYHRVERLSVDPWQLAVTPDRFADQMRLLAASRTIVPLSWLASRTLVQPTAQAHRGRHLRRRLHRRLPERAPDPRSSGLSGDRIHNDRSTGLGRRVLVGYPGKDHVRSSPSLPETLEFDLQGAAASDRGRRRREWRASGCPDGSSCAASTGRPRVPEPHPRRSCSVRARGADPRPRDLAMGADEVADMASSGLVEIGAHTVTHPPMTSLARKDQAYEAAESRRRCEEIIGRPVSAFAYPYGDFDRNAASTVKEAGLLYACSTVGRAVGRGTDPFAIPRLLAADWDNADFRREVLEHG